MNDDAEMLRWIALYVTSISSLECRRGERLEMQATDVESGKDVLVSRTGRNHLDALARCVRAGMKQIPLPKSLG